MPLTEQSICQKAAEHCVNAGQFPGTEVLLESPTETMHGVAGVSNLSTQSPLAPNTRFYIGSITKTFVAVVILKYQELGLLELSDPLSKYLPQQLLDPVANAVDSSLYHLLQHTSGIPDYFHSFLPALYHDPHKNWQQIELLPFAHGHGSTGAIGEKAHYCNTNYILLGLVIEAITQNSLQQSFYNTIFAPLSLENTSLGAQHYTGKAPISEGYGSRHENDTAENSTLRDQQYDQIADGGIISTASDLAKFSQALFYTQQLLHPESVERMLANPAATDHPQCAYGLGIHIFTTQKGLIYGHSGTVIGHQATFKYSPHTQSTLVALGNRGILPGNLFLETYLSPFFKENF